MKKGKYLITGCAGFIGSNLVKNLYKNYELILVDDLSEGSVTNLPNVLRKKLIKKKIQNIKKLNAKKINGIFHLAAQASVPLSLEEFYKSSSNNLLSSIKVFEFSKELCLFGENSSIISLIINIESPSNPYNNVVVESVNGNPGSNTIFSKPLKASERELALKKIQATNTIIKLNIISPIFFMKMLSHSILSNFKNF